MEKKARITVSDLPPNLRISREEMRMITGGWKIKIGRYEFGTAPSGDSDMDDTWYYLYDHKTGEVWWQDLK